MIPCVKHQLAILSHAFRLTVIIELAYQHPYRPLGLTDFWLSLFVVSVILHEVHQARLMGPYKYFLRVVDQYDYMARRDIAFATVAAIGLSMRFVYSGDASSGNSTKLDALAVEESPQSYRIVMVVLNFVQVAAITRLLCAMKGVGVLFASISHMIYRLGRVVIPALMVGIAVSVSFQLFNSPDGWLNPLYRFISVNDDTMDVEWELAVMSWAYTLVIDLLLLNLMIAIMTETYFNVAHTLAPSAWRKLRVALMTEFLNRPVLPQPFDIVEVLLGAGVACYRRPPRSCVRKVDSPHGTRAAPRGVPSPRLHRASSNLSAGSPTAAPGKSKDEDEAVAAEQRVFRALREYTSELRRRGTKDSADAVAGERITEQQHLLKALVRESTSNNLLLLSQRDQALELQTEQRQLRRMVEHLYQSERKRRHAMTEPDAGAKGTGQLSQLSQLDTELSLGPPRLGDPPSPSFSFAARTPDDGSRIGSGIDVLNAIGRLEVSEATPGYSTNYETLDRAAREDSLRSSWAFNGEEDLGCCSSHSVPSEARPAALLAVPPSALLVEDSTQVLAPEIQAHDGTQALAAASDSTDAIVAAAQIQVERPELIVTEQDMAAPEPEQPIPARVPEGGQQQERQQAEQSSNASSALPESSLSTRSGQRGRARHLRRLRVQTVDPDPVDPSMRV